MKYCEIESAAVKLFAEVIKNANGNSLK